MNPNDAISVFSKTLGSMDGWLTKAEAHAGEKKFDIAVLLAARLAPDQYPLVTQFQAACDTAKYAAAKLAGVEPPSHPDTESTVEQLRARVRSVREYLSGFSAEQFSGFEERRCAQQWMRGKWMRGADYLLQVSHPQFYFHASHAYAILRHNGVPLGILDYLAPLSFQG
ncbi:MAG TPA: DUF1993 domain-containing protein [Kofleriaceae bacterium]|nr:DUF1993 domain-containing protein [Kofleriaceae bacterium]